MGVHCNVHVVVIICCLHHYNCTSCMLRFPCIMHRNPWNMTCMADTKGDILQTLITKPNRIISGIYIVIRRMTLVTWGPSIVGRGIAFFTFWKGVSVILITLLRYSRYILHVQPTFKSQQCTAHICNYPFTKNIQCSHGIHLKGLLMVGWFTVSKHKLTTLFIYCRMYVVRIEMFQICQSNPSLVR